MSKIDLARAKRRIESIKDSMSENWDRMREDMRFSNPADPQQWDADALQARRGGAPGECARPCLTFDRTNQYIGQVVNDARQNKPAIQCLPVDDGADVKVAQLLNGVIRHIEYTSRAGIAYDTAIDLAARVGLGWLRVVPKVVNSETNEQELRIERLYTYDSAGLDPTSTEPDGQDAMYGYIEGGFSDREGLRRQYPGKRLNGSDDKWFKKDQTRTCEYFEIQATTRKRVRTARDETMWRDDYDAERDGELAQVDDDEYEGRTRDAEWDEDHRIVCWAKLSGGDLLEESEFPTSRGQAWIPLVPVMGDEVWYDGKRYLCGMTRKLRPAQQAYNYERTAYIEAVALQPRAPFVAAWEAIGNHEAAWASANSGNQAYLPYDATDEHGNMLPPPARQGPPTIPAAFIQGAQAALGDLEAAVGMYRANLGAPGNERSGRAINARKIEGDTATFHYIDNLARSIEQLGRIVVSAIPKIYDRKRMVRIVQEDGTTDTVQVDPGMQQASRIDKGKVVAINPSVGKYDVRVKVGPGYTTQRQEAALNITEMARGNPQIAAALGPILARMQDWPEQDKVSRVLMAMLPPPVQQAYEDGAADIPPAVQAQMMTLQQQNQQLMQALQQAQVMVEGKQAENQAKVQDFQFKVAEAKDRHALEAAKIQQQQAELTIKQQETQIKGREVEVDAFRAETERMQAQAGADQAVIDSSIAAQAAQAPEPVEQPDMMGELQAIVESAKQQQGTDALATVGNGLAALMAAQVAPKAFNVQRDEFGNMVGGVIAPV